jgi:hypothetical protein
LRLYFDFPEANDLQKEVLKLLHQAMIISQPSNYFGFQAERLIIPENGFISKLPDDQWITEIQGWASSAWAGMQMYIADRAIGPVVRNPDASSTPGEDIIPPSTPEEKKLCSMQKVLKTGGFT